MAIDLGRWLRDRKKQAEGVVAQANPFDGNKTYSTVVNNRQPTPRPQSQQPQQFQDSRSTFTKNFDQFNIFDRGKSYSTPSVRMPNMPKTTNQLADETYGAGFTGVKNRVSDFLDTNSQADRIKRAAETGLNESFDQEQTRKTKEAFNNKTPDSAYKGSNWQKLALLSNPATAPLAFAPDKVKRWANDFSKGGLKTAAEFATQAPARGVQLYGAATKSDNPIIRTLMATNPATAPNAIMNEALRLTGRNPNKESGQKLETFGKDVVDASNNKIQQSGIGDRVDDNKWAKLGGSSVVQIPIQLATGGAGLAGMGSMSAGQHYDEARAAGKTDDDALTIGLAQGIATAASEKITNKMFGPKDADELVKLVPPSIRSKVISMVTGILGEASQEVQQQFTENLITNKTYDEQQGLTENLVESGVGGTIGGGFGRSTQSILESTTPRPDVQTQQAPVQTQPDTQSMIERIRAAKDAVLNPQPLNQTGAIQVPGGQDTQLNDTELGVINYLNNKPQVEGDATRSEGNALPSDQPTSRRQELLDKMKQLTKPMNEGGYVEIGRTPKNIHQDDQNVMSDFIDHARGVIKLNEQQAQELEIDASRIAERYGLPMPNTVEELANTFDERLQKEKFAQPKKKLFKPLNEVGAIGRDVRPETDPLESLKQEARKYKSAEEFADSLNAMKYGKVTGVGQLPVSKINKAQIKALTERGLPHTDTNLKVSDFKPGRQVTQPLEVYSKGGSWVVENGNHRLAQALANGDETVPVVFKGGEGKKYSTPITDLYNQAKAQKLNQQGFAKVPDLGKGRLAKFASRNTAPLSTPVDTTPAIAKQVTKPKVERKTTTQQTQSLPNLTKENVVSSSNSKPKSRFAQRASTSEEISPELQSQIKKKDTTYTKQTNKEQIEKSTKLVNKGYKVAASDVSSRLDSKNSGSDAQTVADTIAVIKKLDEKGNPANYQIAAELTDKLSERLTEAGQTVQAASLLYNRTPQGLYYSARRTLKKAGVELTPKLDAELQTLLKDVKSTKADSEEGQLARFKFIEKVNKSVPSGNADKAVQIWKAGLLSGPITQVGNITANTLEQSVKRLYEDPVATGVDAIMSVFTGKRSKSLTARGVASGAQEGAIKGISYFKTGFDPRNPSQKFDVRNIHYSDTKLGRLAEGYTQAIFKSMGTSDQPFYYASMRNSLYDQAITDAKNQGLKGQAREEYIKKFITEPSKKALQLADTEARYDVFQNKTKLGEAASGLKGKTGAVGDFFIPFSGVPSSIATRIVERTPLGTSLEIAKQIKSGKFDQRQMSKAIARGTTGIVMIGIGKALAEADLFTLGFPKEDEEKKLWEVEGRQPYSIKIGGKWISLNYFQPAGTLMAAGGEYQKAKEEGASEGEAWARAIASGGKALTEQSFLKGVSGVLNAVTDPKRFGDTLVENTAGSTVPNWLRAPTRAFDSADRQVNNAVDSIKAGIPGLRQTLDTKVGTFGEDKQRKTSAINSLINPGRPSDVKPGDITTKELRRLQDAGQGIMPSDIDRNSLGGETKLSDKQISELERIINPEIKTAWDKAVVDPRYQKLDDEGKKKALRSISEDISAVRRREYAAKNQLGQYAPDYTGKEPKKLTADQRRLANGGEVKLETSTSSGSYYDKPYKERYEDLKSELDDPNNGFSDVQKIRKQKALAKLAIQKDYPDEVNDLYSLSKNDIYDYITTNKNGKKLGDQLVKLDQALYDAGRVSYRKFKNGIITATASRGGGRGGKGGSKKSLASAQAALSFKLASDKKLRDLLASTSFKGKSAGGSAKRGKVAQRKIVVNTKA